MNTDAWNYTDVGALPPVGERVSVIQVIDGHEFATFDVFGPEG